MKILITGGAGFIGSNLSRFLLKRNYEVTIVDDFSAGKLSNIKGLNVTLFKNKIEELDVKKFKDIDFIVHLAAQASVPLSIEQFYKSSSNNLLSISIDAPIFSNIFDVVVLNLVPQTALFLFFMC